MKQWCAFKAWYTRLSTYGSDSPERIRRDLHRRQADMGQAERWTEELAERRQRIPCFPGKGQWWGERNTERWTIDNNLGARWSENEGRWWVNKQRQEIDRGKKVGDRRTCSDWEWQKAWSSKSQILATHKTEWPPSLPVPVPAMLRDMQRDRESLQSAGPVSECTNNITAWVTTNHNHNTTTSLIGTDTSTE